MAEFEVGMEVTRVSGERYQIGDRGTVVEVTHVVEGGVVLRCGRVRVFWHSHKKKPKRTWVKPGVVRVVPSGDAD